MAARFEDWAADRIAGLLADAGLADDLLLGVQLRQVDGSHEVIADTALRGRIVVGRLPLLEFAVAYGDISDEYLRELADGVHLRWGRPSERDERTRAIVEAIRAAGPGATRDAIAAALGRVDEWGQASSHYKADVRAAGGWVALKRQALTGVD